MLCEKTKTHAPGETRTLTYVINHDGLSFMVREIKKILRECKLDIEKLLGKTRVIAAEKEMEILKILCNILL